MDSVLTTNHEACYRIAEILFEHGVRHVVLSPGSRNAPLIVAFSRFVGFRKYVVVDERSAAFMAVGMSQQLNEPVAVVCTSGSAILNYAPAIAEAYYQHLPIIAISADRQFEWIDQNDSQTIRQKDVLRSIVKKSFDLPYQYDTDTTQWYVNRTINEAVLLANSDSKGPVHINVQLDEPLCDLKEYNNKGRIIAKLEIEKSLSNDNSAELYKKISSYKKTMIVIGIMNEASECFERELKRLASLPNIVVLTENIANVHDARFISTIDRVLSVLDKDKRAEYAPDLLITMGGALVTRMLKQYLRSFPAKEHWRVGEDEGIIDTMQNLTTSIPLSPCDFLSEINSRLCVPVETYGYFAKWQSLRKIAEKAHNDYIASAPWCDLKAFSVILPSIPDEVNLQLSNGTAVRYAQLFELEKHIKCNCNRGVAGIDGATSTALGASLVFKGTTLLISGDMSLCYDLNGLNSQYNSSKFKIIVMCNGGGNIFRIINGPSNLNEIEDYFEVHRSIDVQKYAAAFGFDYFEATDGQSLKKQLPHFYGSASPAILAVKTSNETSAQILRRYFNKNR